VFVTGASRGLGLAMAEAFGRRGARVAICARSSDDLEQAQEHLAAAGVEAFAVACDITQADQVQSTVQLVLERFGRVDVLVNNAGVMEVGPMSALAVEDFDDAIDTMFWGLVHPTFALVPSMRANGGGRIVNITSIGGKVSFPHLLPYSAAKFAAVGFSEGLHAELAKNGIAVTTVCPGLMRTGSPRHATFKSRHRAEYAWFSIGDALPLLSMDAERAARQVVAACRRGEAEVVLSLPAQLAVTFQGVFPGLTADLLGVVNRLLPGPGGIGAARAKGSESTSPLSPSWLTALGDRAAERNNQTA
jgi:short-subunit dehydrogenase